MVSFRFAALGVFAASVCAVPVTAGAQDNDLPIVLPPSSPWNMEYADESCRLARLFGEGEDRIAFYVERYEPGDNFFLLAAGAPLKKGWRGKSIFAFGPDGYEKEIDGPDGTFGQYDPAIFSSGMYLRPTAATYESSPGKDLEAWATSQDTFGQSLSPAAEESIEWIDITRSNKRTVRLQLGPMKAPMAAVRACTDQLLTLWGIDIDAHRTMTRAATPKSRPDRWMDSDDYPTDLLRKGAQGLVQFRLTVGKDGRATDCTIQRSTRPEGFDDAVCKAFLRKAEFQPALDADGKPIVSYWRNAVRFNMGR